MIHLSIKGDIHAAWRAADKHGIELTSIAVTYRDGGIAACVASTYDRFIHGVREWYHEDAEIVMGYGYPQGTLLHFSQEDIMQAAD